MLYDAHCHLQDERLQGLSWDLEGQVSVVNGTREADWEAVAQLARAHPNHIIPSFGLHPWYVTEAQDGWKKDLEQYLAEFRNAGVGETGLDRWIENYDLPAQEQAFQWQMELAAKHNRVLSIHCLQAWGRMLEMLQSGPLPKRGFLLHSYGGSLEMVEPFAELGAYFSFPGYYLHERKHKQRDAFRAVPKERLLVETDAPDQLLPEPLDAYEMQHPDGKERINHPGNLKAVYQGLADMLEQPIAELEDQTEQNWKRLFVG